MAPKITESGCWEGAGQESAARARLDARDGGFSLIEVLVALGILAIIVLGIVGLFTHSMAVNASGFDYARLASVGREVLEDVQSRSFNDAVLAATTPKEWPAKKWSGMQVIYAIQDYAVTNWSQIQGTGSTLPTWPAAGGALGVPANIKKVTIRVRSTMVGIRGRREFVVTSLKVPNGGGSIGAGAGGGGTGGGGSGGGGG